MESPSGKRQLILHQGVPSFQKYGTASWDHSKLNNVPKDHQKINVYFVFDDKHDGHHKARLLVDGHLTSEPLETVYTGGV